MQQQQQQQGYYPNPFAQNSLRNSAPGVVGFDDSFMGGSDIQPQRDTYTDSYVSHWSSSSSGSGAGANEPSAPPAASYPVISATDTPSAEAAAGAAHAQFPFVHQYSYTLTPPPPAAQAPPGFSLPAEPQRPWNPLNPANWFGAGRKQPPRRPPPGPKPSPLQVAAARMPERVVWAPRKSPKPTKLYFSPLALLIYVAFLAAAGYYFYVRVTYSLSMGSHKW